MRLLEYHNGRKTFVYFNYYGCPGWTAFIDGKKLGGTVNCTNFALDKRMQKIELSFWVDSVSSETKNI